jgi:uncharacterized SAM-binding protein YcdF (DUF218 family)
MDAEHALRAIARSLVLLPLGPILLASFGLWLGRRRPLAGRLVVGGALGLLLALSLPVVANRLSMRVEAYPPLDPSLAIHAEVIVVLGGGMRRPPPPAPAEPGADTLERLAGGAALARRTGLPLLVSGGTLDSSPPEADAMAESLRQQFGLEVRFVERRSRDTRENAIESARLLRSAGLRRVLLVTSAVHMRRALAEFEAVGLEVVPAPVAPASASGGNLGDWLPQPTALEISHAALYELGGQLVAGVRRRL